MKQPICINLYEQILELRSKLAQAYDRGDAQALREMSERLDRIQLEHWARSRRAGAT